MGASQDILGGDSLDEALRTKARIVELSSEDEDSIVNKAPPDYIIDGPPFPGMFELKRRANLPAHLLSPTLELFHEALETTTSRTQQATTKQCLPFLTLEDTQSLPVNSYGVPHLRRKQHADFLRNSLKPLPAPYVVIDASRPWLFYWAMAGLTTLGEDVAQYRERLISTLEPFQNATGGFGGGYGQLSHCACGYAAVLALATVDGLHMIDREAMWNWLGLMKQGDGGFCMAMGAEEDVRGAYCALTIINLLNLPLTLPPDSPARLAGLESFTDKLGEWIGRCQTYEGSIAGAPNNEAHGAYAFCALACLSIIDAPSNSIPKYLDLPALLQNLASLQTQPEGGFAGRTNKLVDACYSHWVGGCWSLLEAAAARGHAIHSTKDTDTDSESFTPSIWSRAALIRYLLTCCQNPGKRGGMRDKPSANPDGYHTCYSLSGLSAAQNHYEYDKEAPTIDENGRLLAAFNWQTHRATGAELKDWKIDNQDVVEFVHPVFVIPFAAVENARNMFPTTSF